MVQTLRSHREIKLHIPRPGPEPDSQQRWFEDALTLSRARLVDALRRHIESERRLDRDERRAAVAARLKAWLALGERAVPVIHAYGEVAAEGTALDEAARLEAERDAAFHGFTSAEFRALARLVPWFRRWDAPAAAEFTDNEALTPSVIAAAVAAAWQPAEPGLETSIPLKFSAWPGSAQPWPDLLSECEHVAATGWDGIWIADHFMPNRPENTGPTQEAWTLLAALAARVPRVRLGSLVTGNTYRNPAVLAKQAAQVDIISGGRCVLGIGAGWQQNEHEAYGIPFYTVGGRLRRLEEAVQVIRSLFENEHTDFDGKYYKLKNAPLSPKPLQPRLPILVGGGGEKVTMRIAGRYADEWNTWGTPEVIARKVKVLDRHAEDAGRDPRSIKRSCQAIVTISDDPAVVERARSGGGFASIAGSLSEVRDQIALYAEAGVDEFIVPDFNLGRDVESRKAGLDRFIEDVAPAFR